MCIQHRCLTSAFIVNLSNLLRKHLHLFFPFSLKPTHCLVLPKTTHQHFNQNLCKLSIYCFYEVSVHVTYTINLLNCYFSLCAQTSWCPAEIPKHQHFLGSAWKANISLALELIRFSLTCLGPKTTGEDCIRLTVIKEKGSLNSSENKDVSDAFLCSFLSGGQMCSSTHHFLSLLSSLCKNTNGNDQ